MKDYKPLLVVKMPIGRKPAHIMRKDMNDYREMMIESFGEQYNLALVGTEEKEWSFDGFFATDEDIEIIKKKGDTKVKEILKSLENGK